MNGEAVFRISKAELEKESGGRLACLRKNKKT